MLRLTEGPALVAFTLASNGVGTVTPAADLVARAKSTRAPSSRSTASTSRNIVRSASETWAPTW